MKQCQDCGLNPANVHLTQIVDTESRSFHLCEECAKKRGIHITIAEDAISTGSAAPPVQREDDRECPVCRKKLSEFRIKGWLGCAMCYDAFEQEVDELLGRVHGAKVHRGKQYRRGVPQESSAVALADLRLELESAIKNEQFERAAQIRDTISSMNGTDRK